MYMLFFLRSSSSSLVACAPVIRLSRDHKPNSEHEVERIRSLGGLVMPDKNGSGTQYRVTQMFKMSGFGGVAVSRALGDFHLRPLLEPEPWVSYTDLGMVLEHRRRLPAEEREDCILILACDGVWDVLSDREACAVVRGERNVDRVGGV
jgi:serine/threonine protein phosphatase PrpC